MTGACQAHSTGAVLHRCLMPSQSHAILRTAPACLGFQLQLQAKTGLPSDWQAAV